MPALPEHSSELSTQASSNLQLFPHAEYARMLMRAKAAEEEVARLRAQLELNAANRVHIVVQVTELISLDVRVVEAPAARGGAAQPAGTGPTAAPSEPCARANSRTALAPHAPACLPTRVAAAAAAAPPQKLRRQQPAATPPSGLDWVVSGLEFAAGSSRDAAHAAVAGFAAERLGMADAAPLITVLRVSSQRKGLAVVRLADKSVERALRSAKASLPRDCCVSIYRSLPPEQRGAAAQLRLASRREQLLMPQDVAAARCAAKAALDFARRRITNNRRSPSHRAFCPPPVSSFGVPSVFSVLHDESASTASPVAEESAEVLTPPAAVAAAETMPAAACINVC
jgi:hypothetical protein